MALRDVDTSSATEVAAFVFEVEGHGRESDS